MVKKIDLVIKKITKIMNNLLNSQIKKQNGAQHLSFLQMSLIRTSVLIKAEKTIFCK